jgi:glycerol-3-phosphate acyltransferase PlsY
MVFRHGWRCLICCWVGDGMSLEVVLIFSAFAYLIGSIPFGLVLTQRFLKKDIRTIGSGNIGATNVLRTGNKFLALLTLLLDSGKGAFAIFLWIAFMYSMQSEGEETIIYTNDILIVGLFAILGHCFPVWLKFKGGKGVSTALGVLLAAVPYAGLAAALVWIGTLFLTRISSASALAATFTAPVVTLIIYGPMPALIVLAIALLIAYRHKDNIKRLLKGEEPKVGKKKDA